MPASGLAVLALVLAATPAFAYVGPGLGLGALGAALGVLLSVLLAVVALFWYPVKRMLKRRKSAGPAVGGDDGPNG